jgi:beta-glucosidase
MTTNHPFPPGFLWGTASASHQVEGGNTNNQWAAFENQPGAIWHDDKIALACDWWQNAEQDFDRMAGLGLNAHRLSLEWSRIEPEPGRFDHTAIARYREMLDGLLSRGMTPLVTLHHFTEPLWFTRMGGWENGASIALFRRYAEFATRALGDLCDFWATINEPLVYITLGWFSGIWPPSKKNFPLAMRVMRHLLFAHAEAYHAIHAHQPQARVGYAKHVRLFTGLRPNNRLDRYAAGLRRWLFEHIWVAATDDGWLRPPLSINRRDSRLAKTIDYIGLNYYTRDYIRFGLNPSQLFGEPEYLPSAEHSDSGRDGPFSQFDPEGLYQVCQEVHRFRPDLPIYITENGLPDWNDDQRSRWLVAHLSELQRAIVSGCDVRGYFHWTLTDNFEWAEGWGLRFGLFALDPATQARTSRPSATVYAAIAQANGIPMEGA